MVEEWMVEEEKCKVNAEERQESAPSTLMEEAADRALPPAVEGSVVPWGAGPGHWKGSCYGRGVGRNERLLLRLRL